ncbi:MAG TPA: hypothetical protein P5204_00250 [Kiritimatiellia bacterium]|nr:hypothetical protein [Kiritimatiellia bacterium]
MADPFDGLISTGLAPVALDAARLAGGMRLAREDDRARRAEMFQGLFSESLGAMDRMDARDEAGRQFDAQMRLRGDELAMRREESAFARLGKSLEFGLKFAEQESKDRQQAFENTLRMQQHMFQQKIQSMQLRELEDRVAAQDFMAEDSRIRASYNEYSNPNAFADALEANFASNSAARRALVSTKEGQEYIANLQNTIRAARSMAVPGATRLDPMLVGESLDWGTVNAKAQEGDLASGRLTDDQRQARALLIDEARNAFTKEQIAEIAGGMEGVTDSELVVELVKSYATEGGRENMPHWQKLAAELENPAGEMRFKELYESGALEPIKNNSQIMELRLLEESQQKVLAQRLSETNGAFLFDERYADELDEMKDSIEVARARIMSGGNPRAAGALLSVVSVENMHDTVIGQAERGHAAKRTFGDLAELTGVPGAWRAGKSILLGTPVESWTDYLDLVLTPITIIPGVGLGVRTARAGGGALLRGAARLGGKKAAEIVGNRVGAAAGAKVFTGLAARKGAKAAMVKAVAEQQVKREALRLANIELNAARLARTATRQGMYESVKAAQVGARTGIQGLRQGARAGVAGIDDAVRGVAAAKSQAGKIMAGADDFVRAGRPTRQWFDAAADAGRLEMQAAASKVGARGAAAGAFDDLARARAAVEAQARAARRAGAAGVREAGQRVAKAGQLNRAAGDAFIDAGRVARDAETAFDATRGGLGALFNPISRTLVGDVAGLGYYGQRAISAVAGPGINYRGLENAKRDLDEAVTLVNAGYQSKESLANVVKALTRYRDAVAEYFPGGEVPAEVNETILNIRNLVPRAVAGKIQRAARREFGLATGATDRPVLQGQASGGSYLAPAVYPAAPATLPWSTVETAE